MSAVIGKISPVILTTAQRDALVLPDAYEDFVVIWHETLGRLEYWDGTQWLPFDTEFTGNTGFEELGSNVSIGTSDTDIMDIVVPSGDVYFVEALATIGLGMSFLDDAQASVTIKLTDSSNVELSHALLTCRRPASGSEQYYSSVTTNTIVDTAGGAETIKLRGIRVGETTGGVQATGGNRGGIYYHKILQ